MSGDQHNRHSPLESRECNHGNYHVTRQNDHVRVGLVPYLNVQPLVWAFAQPQFADELQPHRFHFQADRPRILASRLHAGEFDVAIVPVFEYLQHDGYAIVPHSAIATRHSVASVMLYSNVPLAEIETIELDTSSLTSVNLMRVLLAERGLAPALRDTHGAPGDPIVGPSARVLIGDPALRERGIHPFQYDLGELWFDLTGLPFVFAVWLVPPGSGDLRLNAAFRLAREIGEQHIEQVAKDVAPQFGFSPDFALRYFRDNLAQDFDERQQQGLREYARLCAKHRLCPAARDIRWHTA
jgi:chorismate dehydratase